MSGMDLTVQNMHPLQWIQITKHKEQDMVGHAIILMFLQYNTKKKNYCKSTIGYVHSFFPIPRKTKIDNPI
jgi:hypothetical protein